MKAKLLAGVVLVAACGEVKEPPGQLPDASNPGADSAPGADAPPPDAACEDVVLFTGGMDPTSQGWMVAQGGPASITSAGNTTRIATTSTAAAGGGFALLHRANVVAPDEAFALRFEILVESTAGHNQFDAPSAILGSYSSGLGTGADRAQMIFLDGGAVGWADDSQTKAINLVDGAFHTYLLVVDKNAMARLFIDGTLALERPMFGVTGAIAVGDQTNDANVDAVIQVRSITKVCRP